MHLYVIIIIINKYIFFIFFLSVHIINLLLSPVPQLYIIISNKNKTFILVQIGDYYYENDLLAVKQLSLVRQDNFQCIAYVGIGYSKRWSHLRCNRMKSTFF